MAVVQPRFEVCERHAELRVGDRTLFELKYMAAAQHKLVLVDNSIAGHVEHPVQLVPAVTVLGEIQSNRKRQRMHLRAAYT